MVNFLVPFFDEIETGVFNSKTIPDRASRQSLADGINNFFPGDRSVFTESGEQAIRKTVQFVKALRGWKHPSIVIPSFICGSVYRAVKDLGHVTLMDADHSLNCKEDDASQNADIVLFASLGGKRRDVPFKKNPDQILIDDACQCFDGISGFRPETDFSIFSFGKGKQMYAGGGGVIYSSRYPLGELKRTTGEVLPDWQLFLINSQLSKINSINQRRRENGLYYLEKFSNIPWLTLPDALNHSFLKFNVFIEQGDLELWEVSRTPIMSEFFRWTASKGVEIEDTYWPLHVRFPAELNEPRYRKFEINHLWPQLVTLPCHPSLKKEDLDRVIEAVKEFQTRVQKINTGTQTVQSKPHNRQVYEENYTASQLDIPAPNTYFGKLYKIKMNLVKFFGKDKRIIDLGCGSGSYLIPLKKEGYLIDGLDFSEPLLKALNTYWKVELPNFEAPQTFLADMGQLPLREKSYNVAFSFSTLYYMPDIEGVIAEMQRTLKEGGVAILDFGNQQSLNNIEAQRVSTGVISYHIDLEKLFDVLSQKQLSVIQLRAFQLFPLYGGKTQKDIKINSVLTNLLADEKDGIMLDELLSSSPLLYPFAFRHLIVVQKNSSHIQQRSPLSQKSIEPEHMSKWWDESVQNMRVYARELAQKGQIEASLKIFADLLKKDPCDALTVLNILGLFEDKEYSDFGSSIAKSISLAMPVKQFHGTNPILNKSDTFNLAPIDLGQLRLNAKYRSVYDQVRASKTVVDLGCGGNPVEGATAAVDFSLEPTERGSGGINDLFFAQKGIRFANQRIDIHLPFMDKEFDYAFSRHSFEHTEDPATACEEMMRIAKEGVIITPSYFMEIISGRDYHKWLVLERGQTIFFFEKSYFEDRPFGKHPSIFDAILNDGDWYHPAITEETDYLRNVLRAYYYGHSPLVETVFKWKDHFNYQVIRKDGILIKIGDKIVSEHYNEDTIDQSRPQDIVRTPPINNEMPKNKSQQLVPLMNPQTKMGNSPRVSVILPTYNHKAMLPASIQSLLGQTFQNFELIIVNDGSTDGTREYLDGLNDAHIRVIHQDNKKLPGALNTGFSQAKGDYLTWTSDDNFCGPLYLEALAAALDSTPEAGFAYSAFAWVDEQGNITGIHRDQDFTYHHVLVNNPGNCSFMYRRSVQERLGLYDTQLEGAEDWDMWIRMVEKFQVVYVPEVLYYYRLHGDTMTALKQKLITANFMKAFNHAIERLGSNVELVKIYPEITQCSNQGEAQFYAAFDFGSDLLRSHIQRAEFAVQFLEAALKIGADSAAALTNLTLAYARCGQWDKASGLIDRLKQMDISPEIRSICEKILQARSQKNGKLLMEIPVFLVDKNTVELFRMEAKNRKVFSYTASYPDRHSISFSQNPTHPDQIQPVINKDDSLIKVSVIVPTFNRPKLLTKAIQSILNQTYTDYEIIVVNDAGEDVSQVVKSFNQPERIYYINHAKNKGLGAARNTGIQHAGGKYIAYLDDDDLYYADHLETLVQFLENNPYQAAYTDANRAHQQKEGDDYVTTERNLVYSIDFNPDLLLVQNITPVLCMMHAKSCLDQAGWFDETLSVYEDWDLWIRMAHHYPFAHIKKTTCEYTWREDGSTMSSSRTGFDDLLPEIYQRYRSYAQNRQRVDEAQSQSLKERKKSQQHRLAAAHLNQVLSQTDFPLALKSRDFEIDESMLAVVGEQITAADLEKNAQKSEFWKARHQQLEAAFNQQQKEKAARLLQQILDAEDIESALTMHQAQFDHFLLELVVNNQKQASREGETDLAEGMAELASYIQSALETAQRNNA